MRYLNPQLTVSIFKESIANTLLGESINFALGKYLQIKYYKNSSEKKIFIVDDVIFLNFSGPSFMDALNLRDVRNQIFDV